VSWRYATEEQVGFSFASYDPVGNFNLDDLKFLPADARWTFDTTLDGKAIDLPFVFDEYRYDGFFYWKFTPPQTGEYSIVATVEWGDHSATAGPCVFSAYPPETPFHAEILEILDPDHAGRYRMRYIGWLVTDDGSRRAIPWNTEWTFDITVDGVAVDVPFGPYQYHSPHGIFDIPFLPPVVGTYSFTATARYGSQSSTTAPYFFRVQTL
jgi:hypothetical protein